MAVLVSVLVFAVVLSLLPGSWQRGIQLSFCKAATVGVAGCRPRDLGFATVPLQVPRCAPLADLLRAFPAAVLMSRESLGGLALQRVIASDESLRWAPAAAAPDAPLGPSQLPVATGPDGVAIPVSDSWAFTSAVSEKAFAQDVFSAVRHRSQLKSVAGLAARATGDPQAPLKSAGRSQIPVGDLPLLVTGAAPATAHEQPGTYHLDPQRTVVSIDDTLGTPSFTAPLDYVPARGDVGEHLAAVILDDDSDGLGNEVRLVLADVAASTVTMTFIDVQARSDADAAVLDTFASNQDADPWARALLVSLKPPPATAPTWAQTFFSGASVTRLTLSETPAAGSSASSADSISRAFDSLPDGYFGPSLFQGLTLKSVEQLGAPTDGPRRWSPQPGCGDADLPRPASPPADPPAQVVDLRPATIALSVPGCSPQGSDAGWPQSCACRIGGASLTVEVLGRVSPVDDPRLVAQAMLGGRRTGASPTLAVTQQGTATWKGRKAYRIAYSDHGPGGDQQGTLEVGEVPGGGVGAVLLTAGPALDPSVLESIFDGVSTTAVAR